MSWHRKRHLRHRPEVLADLIADLRSFAPDHTLVSGDLVNIALPAEFDAARAWLSGLGATTDVTAIPGNHDAYVRVPFVDGIGKWAPWMLGDDATEVAFPFVRTRGPVAFVMLSTSNPTPPVFASGTLGPEQLARLETVLNTLRTQNLFRVVVLHHPPEDHPTKPRKALRDRRTFRDVLARTGAELVLHGHQHHSHFGQIAGPKGKIPVLGVPSASMTLAPKKGDEARWNLVTVDRGQDNWHLAVHGRGLTEDGFATRGQWHMHLPFA